MRKFDGRFTILDMIAMAAMLFFITAMAVIGSCEGIIFVATSMGVWFVFQAVRMWKTKRKNERMNK